MQGYKYIKQHSFYIQKQYEEGMILHHNDKIRSRCTKTDCCPIGDMFQSYMTMRLWINIYYDWCIRQIGRVIEQSKGPMNVVVISGTMDGISARVYNNHYTYI